MPAPEKRIEKLEARSERQLATIGKLKNQIADIKAKRAAARSAKASPRSSKPAAKRRKATRSTQASASA